MTERQIEILRFMADFTNEMGSPPTLREIAAALDIHLTTAHYHVKKLVELGHAETRRVSRVIEETRYFPLDLADAA